MSGHSHVLACLAAVSACIVAPACDVGSFGLDVREEQIRLRGTVRSTLDASPVSGASVLLNGAPGAVTGAAGTYELTVPSVCGLAPSVSATKLGFFEAESRAVVCEPAAQTIDFSLFPLPSLISPEAGAIIGQSRASPDCGFEVGATPAFAIAFDWSSLVGPEYSDQALHFGRALGETNTGSRVEVGLTDSGFVFQSCEHIDDSELTGWEWYLTMSRRDMPGTSHRRTLSFAPCRIAGGSSCDFRPGQTILVGDRDGFGFGLQAGGSRPASAGFFDFRSGSDPRATDRTIGDQEFSVSVPVLDPITVVQRTRLRLLALGIQDGDDQVVGSDLDLRLFVSGREVPGAFDLVDQFEFQSGPGFVSTAGIVELTVPHTHLDLRAGSVVELRFVQEQIGSAGTLDAFAIDYLELLFEY